MSNLITCDGNHGGEIIPAVVSTRSHDKNPATVKDWCLPCYRMFVDEWLTMRNPIPYTAKASRQTWPGEPVA